MTYKPKTILLKKVPEDVYKEIVRVQSEHKDKHLTQFSLEASVIKIVRSHIKKEENAL